MAITQARMISLIDSCNTIIAAVDILRHNIQILDTPAQIRDATMRLNTAGIRHEAIESIITAHNMLLESLNQFHLPSAAIRVIAEEHGHFNARRKINDRAASYNRARRRLEQEQNIDTIDNNAPIEINLSSGAEINLDTLHQQIFILWTDSLPYNETINAHTIADLINSLGEPRVNIQAQIIDTLVKSGRLQTTKIGGEYIPSEPAIESRDGEL